MEHIKQAIALLQVARDLIQPRGYASTQELEDAADEIGVVLLTLETVGGEGHETK